MAYYTYLRGELVANTATVEQAVAVAIACGLGASVSNEHALLLHLYSWPELSRETLDRFTAKAQKALEQRTAQPKVTELPPGVIPISRHKAHRMVQDWEEEDGAAVATDLEDGPTDE